MARSTYQDPVTRAKSPAPEMRVADLVFVAAAYPNLPPVFTCSTLHASISAKQCADNAGRRVNSCDGCEVGKHHQDILTPNAKPLRREWTNGIQYATRKAMPCVRCGADGTHGRLIGRMRLVHHTNHWLKDSSETALLHCVSCANRAYEKAAGRNSKGATPVKAACLGEAIITYTVGGKLYDDVSVGLRASVNEVRRLLARGYPDAVIELISATIDGSDVALDSTTDPLYLNKGKTTKAVEKSRARDTVEFDANGSALKISNTSGVNGVSWVGSKNRWVASGWRDGKSFHIGNFDEFGAAAAARAAFDSESDTPPAIVAAVLVDLEDFEPVREPVHVKRAYTQRQSHEETIGELIKDAMRRDDPGAWSDFIAFMAEGWPRDIRAVERPAPVVAHVAFPKALEPACDAKRSPGRPTSLHDGRTVAQWAEALGVSIYAIYYRIRKFGSVHAPATPPAPAPVTVAPAIVVDPVGEPVEPSVPVAAPAIQVEVVDPIAPIESEHDDEVDFELWLMSEYRRENESNAALTFAGKTLAEWSKIKREPVATMAARMLETGSPLAPIQKAVRPPPTIPAIVAPVEAVEPVTVDSGEPEETVEPVEIAPTPAITFSNQNASAWAQTLVEQFRNDAPTGCDAITFTSGFEIDEPVEASQAIDSESKLKSEPCGERINELPKKLTGKQARKIEKAQRRAERQPLRHPGLPATKATTVAIAARAYALFHAIPL
jgi:hypothetical protein